MTRISLQSTLRCPKCGHRETLEMPTDCCRWFHACGGCGAILRPKPGDCCVFCSYGTHPCPPARDGGHCCG
ncbi:GDCCVxC domain-containing (seleno)protein [Roseovarius salinarum]|uniref:GDCCVxC domain-containing (seleno)protein n=1 Tax=Roseovarius salinarum TaxID=1981892 RepID=UPI000C34869C|nr:GDCCVxC domain-containing (seleno)protein [Roseovarius salinarum]